MGAVAIACCSRNSVKKVGDNGAYWAAHGSAKTLSVYATAKFKINGSEYEFQ